MNTFIEVFCMISRFYVSFNTENTVLLFSDDGKVGGNEFILRSSDKWSYLINIQADKTSEEDNENFYDLLKMVPNSASVTLFNGSIMISYMKNRKE